MSVSKLTICNAKDVSGGVVINNSFDHEIKCANVDCALALGPFDNFGPPGLIGPPGVANGEYYGEYSAGGFYYVK